MLFVDGDDREDDNEIKKLKISSFLEHFFHIWRLKSHKASSSLLVFKRAVSFKSMFN